MPKVMVGFEEVGLSKGQLISIGRSLSVVPRSREGWGRPVPRLRQPYTNPTFCHHDDTAEVLGMPFEHMPQPPLFGGQVLVPQS